MTAVTRLALTDFRNHARLTVEAAPGLVVVTGDNGAGKTNLIEALSLLAPGRGLRGAGLGEVARADGLGGWSVAARLAVDGGEIEAGVGASTEAPERRIVRVNGATRPVGALAEWLSLVWLTPAMDRLFAETPGGRRRFLDRLVLALDPGHARQTTRYDAAMRARTRLLAEERLADPAWLGALEAAMADHGAAVAAARADTVAALGAALAQADGAAFPVATLALAGNDAGPDFAAELARRRGQDAAAGRATLGPHRADLVVHDAGRGEAAARASTGEQKALLVGIVLAHAGLVAARTGRPPVLLLDEIAAHFDAGRRAALYDRLAATGAQVWMTGADPALFDGVAGCWLRLGREAGA